MILIEALGIFLQVFGFDRGVDRELGCLGLHGEERQRRSTGEEYGFHFHSCLPFSFQTLSCVIAQNAATLG